LIDSLLKKRFIISAGAAAAIAVGIFISMAQAQAIFVPYFTPTHIKFQGLEKEYPINGTMNYSVSLTGYGSNCIDFQAQVIREHDKERVAYFGEVQDCRKIEIAHGAYNYTKSFTYSGNTVLGVAGDYHIQVNVRDQTTNQSHSAINSFIVVEDSSEI
jgi:hypothetical protein